MNQEIIFTSKCTRFILLFIFLFIFFLITLRAAENIIALPKQKINKTPIHSTKIQWLKIQPVPKKILHVAQSEFKMSMPKENKIVPQHFHKIQNKNIQKIRKEKPKEIKEINMAKNIEYKNKEDSEINQKEYQGNAIDLKRQSLAKIIEVIEKNKKYPKRARQIGLVGKVILKINLQNGKVQRIDFMQKDPVLMFNDAAMSAAEKLLGMEMPFLGQLSIQVPVEFVLSNA